MDVRNIFASLGGRGRQDQGNLPVYSSLPATSTASSSGLSIEDGARNDDCPDLGSNRRRSRTTIPTLRRFLADFTLGFADGLTVPFALTAGLSSLGHTNTVIYAGMAEICAGCISMGIGGYLSAKGEIAEEPNYWRGEEEEEEEEEEKKNSEWDEPPNIDDYLAPLNLPTDLLQAVRSHVAVSSEATSAFLSHSKSPLHGEATNSTKSSPLFTGLSVSLGYFLGGLLPLFPYFFVHDVTSGLLWSFVVCILALFIFGFVKAHLLHTATVKADWHRREDDIAATRWTRVRHNLYEGIRMVMFGGLAAVAAVICVKAFENIMS